MPSCQALFELQQAATVPGDPKTILGDGRPQQGAAELFESRALCRRHAQVGVEIDAVEGRLAGPGRADPRGIRLVPEAQDTGPGPPPEGDAPLDGRAADASQGQ